MDAVLSDAWPEIYEIVARAQSRLLFQSLGDLPVEEHTKRDKTPGEKHDRLTANLPCQVGASTISMAEALEPPQSLTQHQGHVLLLARGREVSAKL